MREFLGISKALQSINGELCNNTAKLSELDKRIKRDTAKLKEIEDNPEGFSEEQKELYKKRLQDLQEERQVRLEFLSQNRKDLQTQVARIKQTIEKILDSDISLGERIRILFRGQGITIFFGAHCSKYAYFNNRFSCHRRGWCTRVSPKRRRRVQKMA